MTLPDLDAIVDGTTDAELPTLYGRFHTAALKVQARLLAGVKPAAAQVTDKATRWLDVAAAAEIASVPPKRIYEWARGKRWASRPTRRCLRIDETEFRRWLGQAGGR